MKPFSSGVVQRQARAIRMLTCLQAGPHFSAKELANHLNVSRRTIFRDLNLIRAAGVSVQFDKDHEAYRLTSPTRYITPPGFSEEDLARLVLATHLSPLQNFDNFSTTLREAIAKLLSIYPYQVSSSISRLLHACVRQPPSESYPPNAESTVSAVFDAIRKRRQIRVSFLGPDNEVMQTKLAPYRVVASWDEWEVVGRSSVHRETTSFPLRCIQRVEPTDESYGVPRGYRFRR